ncbi:hypothetical protein FA95DRAFT_1571100 [Auriscalpium vulgare]|uniref:Uncharacterized protein n=1 Tax=Auriscalpium vulgare TaxID=40419 RepID=A0ACB8RZS8_9AGAM|nr:hypothetical protein FA95DRAFT_1571100 [Auriscalpium vulgare]
MAPTRRSARKSSQKTAPKESAPSRTQSNSRAKRGKPNTKKPVPDVSPSPSLLNGANYHTEPPIDTGHPPKHSPDPLWLDKRLKALQDERDIIRKEVAAAEEVFRQAAQEAAIILAEIVEERKNYDELCNNASALDSTAMLLLEDKAERNAKRAVRVGRNPVMTEYESDDSIDGVGALLVGGDGTASRAFELVHEKSLVPGNDLNTVSPPEPVIGRDQHYDGSDAEEGGPAHRAASSPINQTVSSSPSRHSPDMQRASSVHASSSPGQSKKRAFSVDSNDDGSAAADLSAPSIKRLRFDSVVEEVPPLPDFSPSSSPPPSHPGQSSPAPVAVPPPPPAAQPGNRVRAPLRRQHVVFLPDLYEPSSPPPSSQVVPPPASPPLATASSHDPPPATASANHRPPPPASSTSHNPPPATASTSHIPPPASQTGAPGPQAQAPPRRRVPKYAHGAFLGYDYADDEDGVAIETRDTRLRRLKAEPRVLRNLRMIREADLLGSREDTGHLPPVVDGLEPAGGAGWTRDKDAADAAEEFWEDRRRMKVRRREERKRRADPTRPFEFVQDDELDDLVEAALSRRAARRMERHERGKMPAVQEDADTEESENDWEDGDWLAAQPGKDYAPQLHRELPAGQYSWDMY